MEPSANLYLYFKEFPNDGKRKCDDDGNYPYADDDSSSSALRDSLQITKSSLNASRCPRLKVKENTTRRGYITAMKRSHEMAVRVRTLDVKQVTMLYRFIRKMQLVFHE